ncbi:MAG: hypothetical protein IPL52_06365 [Flavobacteriales bacterium]|nr:hypothetical protein [Flavobacteriales bacterium]
MTRRALSLSVLSVLSGACLAQPLRWSADVAPVQNAGLHAIDLSAELLGCSRGDLGDIRLFDSTGAETPYVIQRVMAPPRKERFVPYTLLRNEALKHSTMIEMERPEDATVDALHIWIRPVQVEKRVRITGSDDRQQWYMVKDEHVVAQGARGDPPHQVLQVSIPRSDYRYLRIAVNDSLTAPLRILGVGRFESDDPPEPRYGSAQRLAFTQHDSAGITTLRVERGTPLLVERLRYDVTDSGLFRRNGRVSVWRRFEHAGDRRKAEHRRRIIRHADNVGWFSIGSDLPRVMDAGYFRADSFDVVIENGSDAPLTFTELVADAQQHVLIAQLKEGMRYTLRTGSDTLASPRYDLAHFADKLAPLDTLSHHELLHAPAPAVGPPTFDPSVTLVWAAIIALMALMGWFAMRMLRKPAA